MDIARGELVEKELSTLIERRSRKGETDRDEQEEIYKQSIRAYNARRSEQMRLARLEFHQGQAARLRATLEALAARHEQAATKLMEAELNEQPKGAA